MKIILGVTGSIACFKACEVASLLVKKGYQVYTIMTEAASKFITPLTFRSLTGNSVFTEIFEEKTTHIDLAKDVDLILVAPATANFISKLVYGITSDLLVLTIISTQAPVLICPAMNETMYKNKIVQANIAKLKKYGYNFLGPYKGWLSCGYEGIGRLAEPEDIVKKVEELLK